MRTHKPRSSRDTCLGGHTAASPQLQQGPRLRALLSWVSSSLSTPCPQRRSPPHPTSVSIEEHWGQCWRHLNNSLPDSPLQYSCLENPMDGGAREAAYHGVMKSRTRLSDFTFTFHFHALEKEMATHSSVLAWRIPGTGEPGGPPSMGSHRVGHD